MVDYAPLYETRRAVSPKYMQKVGFSLWVNSHSFKAEKKLVWIQDRSEGPTEITISSVTHCAFKTESDEN